MASANLTRRVAEQLIDAHPGLVIKILDLAIEATKDTDEKEEFYVLRRDVKKSAEKAE